MLEWPWAIREVVEIGDVADVVGKGRGVRQWALLCLDEDGRVEILMGFFCVGLQVEEKRKEEGR